MWVRDLNFTRNAYHLKTTLRIGVDGSPLSKSSKSPDDEHALVPPLIRKFQVRRQILGIAVPPAVFRGMGKKFLFFSFSNLKNRGLMRLIRAVGFKVNGKIERFLSLRPLPNSQKRGNGGVDGTRTRGLPRDRRTL